MARPLYLQLQDLEGELLALKTKIDDLSKSTEEKDIKPYSAVGSKRDRSQTRPTDVSTGLGQVFTGGVIWNDSEQIISCYGQKPNDPEKGYNRHSHSRFSGGALDVKTLEIVEYDVDWETGNYQKDCQSLWRNAPTIKKQQNIHNENVDKIGLLDLVFNADTQKWGVSALEIDVKKCFLVQRDAEGNIELDENGIEKKALLYNEDITKTNLVWDKNAKCWRFYAVYAEPPITP
jgi:hypothetical protein